MNKMEQLSRETSELSRATASVCAAHGASHLAAEVLEVLAEEPFLGSPLDVLEALSGVLADDQSALADDQRLRLAQALLQAMQGTSTSSRREKRQRVVAAAAAAGGGPTTVLSQCEWKREYKSQAERFERPYLHELGGKLGGHRLVREQAPKASPSPSPSPSRPHPHSGPRAGAVQPRRVRVDRMGLVHRARTLSGEARPGLTTTHSSPPPPSRER